MLEENIKNIYKEFDFSKKMIFTNEDRREFKEATHRRICKRSFDIGKDKEMKCSRRTSRIFIRNSIFPRR